MKAKIGDFLDRDEIRAFTHPSDVRGVLAVSTDWLLIAASLALVAFWPNVLTVAMALVVIGGRQLGLAILMHEAGHRTLFRTRVLNDWVGKWLCAGPVWQDLERYRAHHFSHHTQTGTAGDPDLCLVEPFPTTPASLARKMARDLSGIAALRRIGAQLAMEFDFITYTASGGAKRIDMPGPWSSRLRRAASRLAPVVLTNVTLALLLAAIGHPWLYLVWVASWLTTYGCFIRLRAIAEHACTERSTDAFLNTRTTRAGWLERLTVAPHHVNYHLEHHLLMTVPYFRLPALHRLLKERGALEGSAVAPNYWSVLRTATARG